MSDITWEDVTEWNRPDIQCYMLGSLPGVRLFVFEREAGVWRMFIDTNDHTADLTDEQVEAMSPVLHDVSSREEAQTVAFALYEAGINEYG